MLRLPSIEKSPGTFESLKCFSMLKDRLKLLGLSLNSFSTAFGEDTSTTRMGPM